MAFPPQYIPNAQDLPPEPPAYHVPGVGWTQGGHVLPNMRRNHYAWVWPKGGTRKGHWGMLKDILSNKGPDIYLTINARKTDYMRNRPFHHRFGRWPEFAEQECLDWYNLHPSNMEQILRWGDVDGALQTPWWAKRKGDVKYDFKTRRYARLHPGMWSDAKWPSRLQGPNQTFLPRNWPTSFRDINGQWHVWDERLF
jgi:hypothetical protein